MIESKARKILSYLEQTNKATLENIIDGCDFTEFVEDRFDCCFVLNKLHKFKAIQKVDKQYVYKNNADKILDELLIYNMLDKKERCVATKLPVYLSAPRGYVDLVNKTGNKRIFIRRESTHVLKRNSELGRIAYLLFYINREITIRELSRLLKKSYTSTYLRLQKLMDMDFVEPMPIKGRGRTYKFNTLNKYPFPDVLDTDKGIIAGIELKTK